MQLSRTAIIFSIILLTLTGCRQDEEIKQETVTHEDREPILLRVAMLRDMDKIWFIRLDGPEALVKEQKTTFDNFVKSVRFTEKANDPITWTEPPTWKKEPPIKGRFASFRIPGPRELEVKITVLNSKGFRLLDNMHRWQKQVHRPLSEDADDMEQYITREMVTNHEVTWITMKGVSVHTASKPADPLADKDKDFFGMIHAGKKIPFKFTVPEGWVQKPPRELLLDVYEITEGNRTAEVTLSTAGGNPIENVNRWRKQIGLPPQAAEEVVKSAQRIEVAGTKSLSIDIANAAGPPEKNRILGVIVPMRQSFFIKMTGPQDIVGRQKQTFKVFVDSFKK